MDKRGRPPLAEPSQRYVITLTLRPGRDDDLIAFLENTPHGHRATAVMAAMRSGNLAAAADEEMLNEDEMTETLFDNCVF
jgi:hypothetical protein